MALQRWGRNEMKRSILASAALPILLAVILLVAAIAPSSAETDLQSANYVIPDCRTLISGEQSHPILSGYCMGSVQATFYFNVLCAPDRVTVEQMVRVVVQYIDSHPARINENFLFLAAEAMSAAWPCRR
jgi:hypothetical protein